MSRSTSYCRAVPGLCTTCPAASSASASRGARRDMAVLVVLVQGLPVMREEGILPPPYNRRLEVPMKPPTRRTFLKQAAAGAAAGLPAAPRVAAVDRAPADALAARADGRLAVPLVLPAEPG